MINQHNISSIIMVEPVCPLPLAGQNRPLPLLLPPHVQIGLIHVKEEGWTGFSSVWQGCSEGFPEGEAQGKSQGGALPARGKTHVSRLFDLDLRSIQNRTFW